MHNIIVCDDNKPFMNMMVMLLKKYADLYNMEVSGFDNGKELLNYCCNNKVDIIYMDIEIGTENGMDLAKTIKRMNPKTLIIYISAYDYYYADMVQAEPFRFILKDVYASDYIGNLEKQLTTTLDAAMQRINGKDMWSFIFDRKQYSIILAKVKYFHSLARTIHIVGDVGEVPRYYYGKMDDLQQEIEKIDSNFIRISKSYIVNMKYARLSSRKQVTIDDKTFSITPKYLETFREQYKDYWHTIF